VFIYDREIEKNAKKILLKNKNSEDKIDENRFGDKVFQIFSKNTRINLNTPSCSPFIYFYLAEL
jgi:hypothetical protein